MSLHPISRRPRVRDARRRARCDFAGDGPLFHNFSITTRVPGDPNTSHQVRFESTHGRRFLPATAFTPTRRDSLHDSNYLVIGPDTALSPTPITPIIDHGYTSAHQHFQGGGTGSNPVGGAQRFPSSTRPFRSVPAARATAAITLSITVAVPARPTASRTDGDCPAGPTVERSRPSRPLDIENARKPHRPRAAQTTCRTPYARMGTS